MSENTQNAGRSGILGTVSRSPEATFGGIGRARRVVVVGIIRRHHTDGEHVQLFANGPVIADQPETGPAAVAVHTVRRPLRGSSWETWHVQPWGQDMPREGWQASGAGIAVRGLPGMPASENAEVVISLHDHREHLDLLSALAAAERVEASEYLERAAHAVYLRRTAVRQAQDDLVTDGIDLNAPAALAVIDPAMGRLREAEREEYAARLVLDAVSLLQDPAPYSHRDEVSASAAANVDAARFAAAVRDPHPAYTPDHVLVLVGAGQVIKQWARERVQPPTARG
ncbi:low molecular weight phosphatase family protein [Oerskovia paurometabola]|uniref:hypothetical protein n=1 Tax=Oerskovia paurometabola TaxID=162170 RepID=UPI0037FC8F25